MDLFAQLSFGVLKRYDYIYHNSTFTVFVSILSSDLQEDLGAIQNNPSRSIYCSQRLLCRTLAGNNVYILTVTSPGTTVSY